VPTRFAFRTVALVVLLAFCAGCLAAVANAQDAVSAPAPAVRTLVAAGIGTATVTPKDRNSNASIVAAVAAAQAKALPAAVTDARRQAQALATATGVTLGALVSVSNQGSTPGYYGPYFYGGSFGPDKYCGTVRTLIYTRDAQGRRHSTGKFRTHRTCRVPGNVQRTVQLTYALG
jgi:uncharacterized protein YggE